MSFPLALAAAIVPLVAGGADDTGDPAVVAIVTSAGVVECSGTVVAPHFVLTAAHCIAPEIANGATAVFGSTADAPTSSVAIGGSSVDPAFDPATLDHDAALLLLRTPAPVTAVPMATSPPAAGSTARIVGWGATTGSTQDYGTKRDGTVLVTTVDALTFDVAAAPSQPCAGDSGGPALATIDGVESVVGITSHGGVACDTGATYTRVDVVLPEFVTPAMASLGAGTASTGAPCAFDEQCVGDGAACVAGPDDANATYCTRSCTENADCGSGMVCVEVGTGDSTQCRYAIPTPRAPGSSCSSSADCVDTECTPTGVCAARCDGVDGCADGFACVDVSGIDFYCLAPAPSVSGGCAAATPRGSRAAMLASVMTWLAIAIARRRPR